MMYPWHTPAALLATGYAVIRQVWPTTTASFALDGNRYRARFELPGRLVVSRWHDGVTLARSKPGRPTVPEKRPRR